MRRASAVSQMVTRPRSARRSMGSYGATNVPGPGVRGRGHGPRATVSATSPPARSRRPPEPVRSAPVAAQSGDALLERGGRHERRRNGLAAHALDARPEAPEGPAHGAPVLAAEEAAPEAAERHGNDGHRRALDDALDAGTERAEGAVRRQPALGEDTDQAPLPER